MHVCYIFVIESYKYDKILWSALPGEYHLTLNFQTLNSMENNFFNFFMSESDICGEVVLKD